jgi:hypothetical protein
VTEPAGLVVFCALASLPDTGAAFSVNGEGEALLRLALDPTNVGDLTEVLRALRARTFYVTLVAHPKGPHGQGTEPLPEPEPEAEDAAQAERPRPRKSRRVAAGKPDRRTH